MLTNVMRSIWPLFLGVLFISLGNGLQGTLSSWRADYEGFSVITTGLVMSGYFLGAFASSLISPSQSIRQAKLEPIHPTPPKPEPPF